MKPSKVLCCFCSQFLALTVHKTQFSCLLLNEEIETFLLCRVGGGGEGEGGRLSLIWTIRYVQQLQRVGVFSHFGDK